MNQVQTVLPQYKAGKVRLLGVTTKAPVAAFKEVPTIASSNIPGTRDFDSSIWFGIFAPKGTDARVVDKLNTAIRSVLEQQAFKVVLREEQLPGRTAVETDEEILDYIHHWAKTDYHPVGTCRMGVDELSVVGPDLKVNGVEGLRVADASIMPSITGGNTNAPCYLIGERAVDFILGRA